MTKIDLPSSAAQQPPGPLAPCWSCKGPVDARALFCHTCGAVQPPRAIDHFTRLALPIAFEIPQADLDRRYFGFQRYLHPDRFATKSAKEKAISQQQAASLNEAYEVLKDPLARAAYLLSLKGKALPGDGQTVNDPVLLMEAMEAREALAEVNDAAQLKAIADRARADFETAQKRLATAFAENDLDAAHTTTLRLRYLDKFRDELRARAINIARGQS